jgi:hypothetical protein
MYLYYIYIRYLHIDIISPANDMDHRRPFLGFDSILGLYHLPHLSFPKSCRSEAPSADSFERGEKIHVWSESRQEWLLGHAGAQGSTGDT